MVTPHFCLQILVETLFSSDAIYQRFTVEIKSRFDLVSLIRFFSSAKDTISKFPLQWFRRILVQSDYWLFRVVCLDREEQCHECCYLVSIITSVLTEQSALSEHNPDISGILVDCQAWIIDTFSFVVRTKWKFEFGLFGIRPLFTFTEITFYRHFHDPTIPSSCMYSQNWLPP